MVHVTLRLLTHLFLNEICFEKVCEDHPQHCDFYWSRGWFTCKNGGALWEYCPKSCGFCGDADAPGTLRLKFVPI